MGEIFIPDCDVICTNAIDEDSELGEMVRRAGKEFWEHGRQAAKMDQWRDLLARKIVELAKARPAPGR